MLGHALCSLSGHRINRKRVWHDGWNFRTECDRCGTALIRQVSGWVPFDEETHEMSGRKSREEAAAK